MAKQEDKKAEKKDETNNPKTEGVIRIFRALVVVILGVVIGYFVYSSSIDSGSRFPFKLGLDLAGGSHLVYEADVSAVDPIEVPEAMSVLRDVIERRVNIFGVSEPIVQVEQSSFVAETPKERLVVELPGVQDVTEAVEEIGKTPLLEFKLVNQEARIARETLENLGTTEGGQEEPGAIISNVRVNDQEVSDEYVDTGLTGRFLNRATLEFGASGHGGLSNEPIVVVEFNSEGTDLFAEITRDNVGEQLAIFLDGESVSEPVIRQSIPGGVATISGNFSAEEARELVRNLNFGALPLPIELQSTQTIGASLGAEVLEKGVKAGLIGITLVMIFMVLWYRLPGLVAAIALTIYVAGMLALFKLVPVTLTAAGLAGFILSIGMAVDANVLVFARMKEEYESGKDSVSAAREGFRRAWSAIRDSNITSFLSAIVLFWFGTSIVKGFALVFGMGVLLSMISAITVTRTLLLAFPIAKKGDSGLLPKLFDSGFSSNKEAK